MKPEYDEGPEVTEKFERAMKLLFQTPKTDMSSEGYTGVHGGPRGLNWNFLAASAECSHRAVEGTATQASSSAPARHRETRRRASGSSAAPARRRCDSCEPNRTP